MGGSQSTPTRKLTIPNEDSNIIKVSGSVAERLRKCTEKTPEDFLKCQEEASKPPPPSEPNLNVRNKENVAYYPGDPLLNFYYGPSITSLRILQEKEKELKESEDYWTNRIQNMEKHYKKMSEVLETEYKKAVEEISTQSSRPPPNTPPPCCKQRNRLLECYKKHPDEILLCAGEVTEFSDCVHSRRIQPPEGPDKYCCEDLKERLIKEREKRKKNR